MKTIRINANHAQESFDNQPAITNNGDSKETSILFESKTINIKCLLSNTKACKWDKKYPENHNHYIVTVSYEEKGCLSIGSIAFKISVVASLIRIEMKLLKCFICFYRILFTKTNIRIKTIFAKKRKMHLFYGVHCASMKINIIECLKALIFTSLQAIYKKHLNFNNLKINDMKTKYIYKGKEILQSTFISLCRKIDVNGGRKFTTLEKLQQEANKGNKKAIELLLNLQIQ